jgi:4'-phosphopantetheinyl transferase EntD
MAASWVFPRILGVGVISQQGTLVYAEAFSDAPEPSLYASEAAVVAGAIEERRREFGTVRACARAALRRLGVPAAPILPDADGVPRWPAGVVGSMTHCPGYRAAVVSRATDTHSIGIDAEPHAPLPDDVRAFVLHGDERKPGGRPDLHWDRIHFCVKEAVYKAWFPLTRRWLEFEDVAVALETGGVDTGVDAGGVAAGVDAGGVGGTFRARVRAGTEFRGTWTVRRGLIVAVAS